MILTQFLLEKSLVHGLVDEHLEAWLLKLTIEFWFDPNE